MLPFCGYNMGDYFAHWLAIGANADSSKLPRIYFVNWFRKDADGKYVWPGFGENSRVLKWISDRIEGTADAVDTPIGRVPSREALDVDGLDLTDAQLDVLLTVDVETWREEAALVHPHYERFGSHTPKALWDQLEALEQRLQQ
jgi:phosphoenolpyruvate carboxykinase (GTP)